MAVGLYALVIDELRGITVVKIVMAIVDNFAVRLSAAEHEVVEHLAADETDVGSQVAEGKSLKLVSVSGV